MPTCAHSLDQATGGYAVIGIWLHGEFPRRGRGGSRSLTFSESTAETAPGSRQAHEREPRDG